MANTPKIFRKKLKARPYEVSCFSDTADLYFKRKDGSKSSHRAVRTFAKAVRIAEGLLNRGAYEATILSYTRKGRFIWSLT